MVGPRKENSTQSRTYYALPNENWAGTGLAQTQTQAEAVLSLSEEGRGSRGVSK